MRCGGVITNHGIVRRGSDAAVSLSEEAEAADDHLLPSMQYLAVKHATLQSTSICHTLLTAATSVATTLASRRKQVLTRKSRQTASEYN